MEYINVKEGNVMFPNRDIPEEEKNLPQYSLDYCKAIYNRYLNDRCAIRYSDVDDFSTLEAYGNGDQSVSKYQAFLSGDDSIPSIGSGIVSNENVDLRGRKGYDNIDWGVVSPIPRIKTIIKGYLDQFGQDVFVDTVDPLSNDTKESLKWRAFATAKNYEFINEYSIKAGLPIEELDFMPANTAELNMFEAMGGFKLNMARAMEKLIRHTENVSKMDSVLKDKLADNALDFGYMVAKLELNDVTNQYEYRWVNPKRHIQQYIPDGRYERSEYAGEVSEWTVSELKQYLPDRDEQFFKDLAISYSGRAGNPKRDDDDNFSKRLKNGSYQYDTFLVEVADVEWIDYECRRHLVYDTNRGRKFVKELSHSDNIHTNQRANDVRTKMRKLRQAKWVVGTDIVFDYGVANMQDRPTANTVMHNYKLVVLDGKSMVESLRPIADDLALCWYKYQNGRAMSVQPGYAIDVGMMQNIGDGGDAFGFLKLIEKWRNSGILLHQQSMSGKYEGGSTTPIAPISSVMMEIINEAMASWEFALRRIEDVTGLNMVMLGATTDPGAAVGTTQMSSQSSVHILKPLIDSIGEIKASLSGTLIRRLQLAFKARKDIVDAYEPVIGSADIQSLIIAEKDAVQYGMTFEPRASSEAKNDIIQGALAAMQTRREGGAGLTLSQYSYIVSQVHANGNLKELSALIDFLVSKSEAQVQAAKDRNMQLQGQINQQNAMSATQGQIALEQTKKEGEASIQGMKNQAMLANTLMSSHPELFRKEAEALANNPSTSQRMNDQPQGGTSIPQEQESAQMQA